MTLFVQPVIAVMMLLVTLDSAAASLRAIGALQFLGIAAVAFYLIQRRRIHPALVIVAAFVYGAVALS